MTGAAMRSDDGRDLRPRGPRGEAESQAHAEAVRERIELLFGMSPDADARMEALDERIARMAADFLHGPDIPPGPKGADSAFNDTLIPQGSGDLHGYLDALRGSMMDRSYNTAGRRALAYMTPGVPALIRPLAVLLTAMNQNMVKRETSLAATSVERQVLAMMHRLVFEQPSRFYDRHTHDSASTLGLLVTGGTSANLASLWCARNRAMGPSAGFAGVEEEGMAAALEHHGRSGAVIVGSSLMHYSFDKAAGLLGIGARSLLRVPTDARHRMDVAELRRVVRRCRAEGKCVLAVVGVAGTTDAGSIDPLEEVADVAGEAGAHFHVDAAWGGPFLFSGKHRERLAGIERADSVTIDGHKQLFLPVGIGMALLRDPGLAAGIEKHAHYVVRRDSSDLGRRALDGSRPAMALYLHAALHLIGSDGYEYLVDEGVTRARHLADAVRAAPEFELLAEPETNIVLYRYLPEALRARAAAGALTPREHEAVNDFNVRLHEVQSRLGQAVVSRTRLHGRAHDPGEVVCLRAVVANPLTARDDLSAVLADQVEIARLLHSVQALPSDAEPA